MSPIFGHGRLRLYLLKLLDEAPRHGYEIIRLLQDRFMGVYAPSPGTIYPRLARLEEEGLVTHTEERGKKVYRLTDAGRAEVNDRLDELAELEEEITASARDIASEVREDVRETVRSLREELQSVTKQMRDQAREQARESWNGSQDWKRARDDFKQAREEAKSSFRAAKEQAKQQARKDWWNGDQWAAQWQVWTDEWARDWADWAGSDNEARRARRDLQRMVREYSRDLRRAVDAAGPLDEQAYGEVRELLTETMQRLRTEILEPARDRYHARREDPGEDDDSAR